MIAFEETYHWMLMLLVIIWATGIGLDIKYRVSRMRWPRMIVWSISILAIALFFLQPYKYRKKESIKAALISKSSPPDSLRRAGYQILKNPSDLFSNTFSELILQDTGLSQWQLKTIQAEQITSQHRPVTGLLNFRFEQNILQGKNTSLKITSHFEDNCTLYLLDGKSIMDSTSVKKGNQQTTFDFTPKASGNFTYQVIATIGTDTISKETLPFTVNRAEQPSVLMLQSNPNFEARFIKNYLGDYGYSVSSRTRISRDLFNEEFVNTSRKNLKRITSSLLEQFQLIILDKTAYNLLSSGEKQLIKDLNKVGNLGILLINTAPAEMNNLWTYVPTSIESTTAINGINFENEIIRSFPTIKSINKTIGYYESNGIGKVGLLTVESLYQLVLQGQQTSYNTIIQQLTESLLPYQKKDGFIQLINTPRLLEKTNVKFTSSSSNPTIVIDNTEHPIRESAYRPGLYETDFWPQKEGWTSLYIQPDSIQYDYYVFGSNDWSAKKANDLFLLNDQYSQTLMSNSNPIQIQEKYFLPKWIYLVAIILSLGLLWAEQRFVNP